VDGNLPADIPYMIEYHDKQMALAGLAHFLNLDKGGSYALASVQADTFTQSVQTVADTIRDTAQAHIIEDLVDINFGPRRGCRCSCRRDRLPAGRDGRRAADAGRRWDYHADPRLEAFERQTLGLPSVDPDAPDPPRRQPRPPPESAAPQPPEGPYPQAHTARARRRPRATMEFYRR
jgi:hypothetical protein